MISVKIKGDWHKTRSFFGALLKREYIRELAKYGEKGVAALREATPKDTGLTSESWDYEIHFSNKDVKIVWTNSNIAKYIPVALLIQYGHATGNGYYIEGIDYINPAMKPIFEEIAEKAWDTITSYDTGWRA